MEDIISCIDIGTTKVCAVVVKVSKSKDIEVLGKSMEYFNGVKKGEIVDIDETAEAIRTCVRKISALTNHDVESAYVNVMGNHIGIMSCKSSADIPKGNLISEDDVERVLESVEGLELPKDRQVIDCIPKQYIIDGIGGITDPIGMRGRRVDVEADIITAKVSAIHSIVKSMENAGLMVDGLVTEAFAAGESALTAEEKDKGVILIDIGGGITNLSVFKSKSLVFYNSIYVGGDHITNDISIALEILKNDADKLKKEFELASTALIKNDNEIIAKKMNGIDNKSLRVSEVVEVIEARVQEIFSLCREMLDEAGVMANFNGSIVLTGGGISYLNGCTELAYDVFDLPAKVASNRILGISKSEFITSIGTAKYILSRMSSGSRANDINNQKPDKLKKENSFFKKLTSLFHGLF